MKLSNLVAAVIGIGMLVLLVWMFKAGDLQTMNIAGVSLANPETTLPKVRVEGIGVHGIIGEGAHTHGPASAEVQAADAAQHQKVESDIFFKPEGLYTAADIARNGPDAPSKKFGEMMARHDLKVHPGERVCPITETRANERFYWWVAGRKYTFCCPPCIEEFVMQAKKARNISELKAPEQFVKR